MRDNIARSGPGGRGRVKSSHRTSYKLAFMHHHYPPTAPRLSVIQEAQDEAQTLAAGNLQVVDGNYDGSGCERCYEAATAAAAAATSSPNDDTSLVSMACDGCLQCLGLAECFHQSCANSLAHDAAPVQAFKIQYVDGPCSPRGELGEDTHSEYIKYQAYPPVEHPLQVDDDWQRSSALDTFCRQTGARSQGWQSAYYNDASAHQFESCASVTRDRQVKRQKVQQAFGGSASRYRAKSASLGGAKLRWRGPKFSAPLSGCGAARSTRGRVRDNRVVNCHQRTTATTTARVGAAASGAKITTKTSRRQTRDSCTQRFKCNHWPAAVGEAARGVCGGREGERAAASEAAAAATAVTARRGARVTVTASVTTTVTAEPTTTADQNKFRHDPRRVHHGHRHRRRSKKHVTCDNRTANGSNNGNNISGVINTIPCQSHGPLTFGGPLASVPFRSKARRKFRPATSCPSTGRQLSRNPYCSSSGRYGAPQISTLGGVLLARHSLPAEAAPRRSSPAALQGWPASATATAGHLTPPLQSTRNSHKALQSSSSCPALGGAGDRLVPAVVVALPFAWASPVADGATRLGDQSHKFRSTVGTAAGQPAEGLWQAGGGRRGGLMASELDSSIQDDAQIARNPIDNNSSLHRARPLQQESTFKTNNGPARRAKKTTMTSEQNMTGGQAALEATRATGYGHEHNQNHQHQHQHQHHLQYNRVRAYEKPFAPRFSKPLLETPSTPPIVTPARVHPSHPHGPARASKRPGNANQARSSNVTHGPSQNNSDLRSSAPTPNKGHVQGSSKGEEVIDVSVPRNAPAHQLIQPTAQRQSRSPPPKSFMQLDEIQAGSNVHSLESVGQRARMAISIYDPLPANEEQIPELPDPTEQANSARSASPGVVDRPTNLDLGSERPSGLLGPRLRRPQRRRESFYGYRFLKSPTIPEEPSELSGMTEDELAAAAAGNQASALTGQHRGRKSALVLHDEDKPLDGFLVASIEPEWGGTSRSMVVHSDSTLESLTQDVLKRLIEIEHDHQNSSRSNMKSDVHSKEKVASKRRFSQTRVNEMSKLQELECEAEKLAKMFKEHLKLQHLQQQNGSTAEMNDPAFVTTGRLSHLQKSDPTAMSCDEQARFFNPDHRGMGQHHRPKRANKEESPDAGDQGRTDECPSAFDFRCSCCCLHLVNQPKRADGESWCCCGCS